MNYMKQFFNINTSASIIYHHLQILFTGYGARNKYTKFCSFPTTVVILHKPFTSFFNGHIEGCELELRPEWEELLVGNCLLKLTIRFGGVELKRLEGIVETSADLLHCLPDWPLVFFTHWQNYRVRLVVVTHNPHHQLGQISGIDELTKWFASSGYFERIFLRVLLAQVYFVDETGQHMAVL